MIKEVNYYPQYMIEETKFNEKHVIISITDSANDKDGIVNIEGTTNILRLHFLDIEEPSINKNYTSFNKVIAKSVIQFIEKIHKEKETYNVIVHCRMGASRSPAIALYVHALTNCNFPDYDYANTPNKMVLSILEEMTGLTLNIPKKPENNETITIQKIKIT